jgi:putative hemolysin
VEFEQVVVVTLPMVTVWVSTSVVVTFRVVTMVLSVVDDVIEAGPAVVLFWNGALEVLDQMVVVVLQGRDEVVEPVVLLETGRLEVGEVVTGEVPVPEWVVGAVVVLFWYGALEVIDEKLMEVLFWDTVEVVEPVVLLKMGRLEVVDEMVMGEVPVPGWIVGTEVVLFWNGALELVNKERVVVLL